MSDLTPEQFATIQASHELIVVLHSKTSALRAFMDDVLHTADPENENTNGLTMVDILANQATRYDVLHEAVEVAFAAVPDLTP